jgi:hypothetical protein
MNPQYCPFHQRWTDGPCEAAKRSLNRHDVQLRLSAIQDILGDGETVQFLGYSATSALEVERATLQALRDMTFMPVGAES